MEFDLLHVVNDSRQAGFIYRTFNATFIALIPKSDELVSLDEYRPISLSNCIYKIISKIISRKIKGVLSKLISCEQFRVLEGRQIHESIGVAEEGLHNLKTKKLKGVVINVDLSKVYDRVCWLYLRMLLTHLGFGIDFIQLIMACITSISFVVLINGSFSPFF